MFLTTSFPVADLLCCMQSQFSLFPVSYFKYSEIYLRAFVGTSVWLSGEESLEVTQFWQCTLLSD